MAKIAKYGIGSGATDEEIRKELRRAGKAANQRLRRLEQAKIAGKHEGYGEAYQYAAKVKPGMNKPRFMERPGKALTRRELLKELGTVLAFLDYKSSTETGRKQLEEARYQSYKDRGFQGTSTEFKRLVKKVFAMAQEKNFSSDTAYSIMTTGFDSPEQQIESINQWLEEMRQDEKQSEGRALIAMLRKRRKGG